MADDWKRQCQNNNLPLQVSTMLKVLEAIPLSKTSQLPREVEDFLVSLVGKSPNTRRLYKHILSKFTNSMKKSPKKLTKRDVIIYLSNLEKRGASRNTMRVHIIVLKTWLKSFGLKGLANQIQSIKEARTPPVAISNEEVKRMIQGAKTSRNKLILLLLYKTGIRVSELLAITVRDINFDEGIIRVKGKGFKTRFVLIDSQTLSILKDYLQEKTSGPIINLSASYIRQIIKKNAKMLV